MYIKISKNNFKHILAFPFGMIAMCCVFICHLIIQEDIEVKYKH